MSRRGFISIVFGMLVVAGGTYGAFAWYESRLKDDALLLLSLLWPEGKVSLHKAEHSFSGNVTILSGIELEQEGIGSPNVSIGKLVVRTPDREAIRAFLVSTDDVLQGERSPVLAKTMTLEDVRLHLPLVYDVVIQQVEIEHPVFLAANQENNPSFRLPSFLTDLRFERVDMNGLHLKAVWSVNGSRKEALDFEAASISLKGFDPAVVPMFLAIGNREDFFLSLGLAELERLVFEDMTVRSVSERPIFGWEYDPNFRRRYAEGARMPSPGTENISLHIDRFELTDLSRGVARSFQVEGVAVDHTFRPMRRARTRERYHLGRGVFEDIDFVHSLPSLVVMAKSPSLEVLEGIFAERFLEPHLPAKTIVRDLRLENPELGIFALKEMSSLASVQDGVVVMSDGNFRGLVWSFPVDTNDFFTPALEAGYTRVMLSGKGHESFSPEDGRYRATFQLDGVNLGEVMANIELSGFPRTEKRTVFDEIRSNGVTEALVERLDAIKVHAAAFHFEDRTLVKRLVAAIDQEVDFDTLKAAEWEQELHRILMTEKEEEDHDHIHIPALQGAFATLSRFFVYPSTINVIINPEEPVLLGQLRRFGGETPLQDFFDRLHLSIKYEEIKLR